MKSSRVERKRSVEAVTCEEVEKKKGKRRKKEEVWRALMKGKRNERENGWKRPWRVWRKGG